MATETLIIVVGGDYLAYEICREILKTSGQCIALLWKHQEEQPARLLSTAAAALRMEFGTAFEFHNEDPEDPESLRKAGLTSAPGSRSYCLVAVSQDDRLNLRVALMARDINDSVRITLRQFNPVLGHKIQEGLKRNCTAISPAAHAAATYAAAAVDPSCFYALPFPTLETLVAKAVRRADTLLYPDEMVHQAAASLFGFSERSALDFGIAGCNVVQAEERLGARIVAINGVAPYICHGPEDHSDPQTDTRPLYADDCVVAFGPIARLKRSLQSGSRGVRAQAVRERLVATWSDLRISLTRTEPILRAVFWTGAVLFVLFCIFFARELHLNLVTTIYFVMTTMTNGSNSDITPCSGCARGPLHPQQIASIFGAMLLILTGIVLVAVFTATLTSNLYAATARRLRGLRRIHRRGHVIVCGAGNVGSLVIEYLRELGERVVVVEKNPDALLIELARDQQVDLLTGDATNDETVAYCSPERAKALIGVTNSDTANLEVALGARTRMRERGNGELHVVLRIDDLAFGASIKRHFGISSFSTTELTAPTIAGLARFESTRGRFEIFRGSEYQRTFQLAERIQGEDNQPPPPPVERPGYKVRWIPLYVWRKGRGGKGVALPVRKFEGDVCPGDRLLFMVPLDQFTS